MSDYANDTIRMWRIVKVDKKPQKPYIFKRDVGREGWRKRGARRENSAVVKILW
jgi:hypothetical protein